MKKSIKQLFVLLSIIIILVLPYLVFAESATTLDSLNKVAIEKGPYDGNANDPTVIVARVISIFLSLLGVVFLILVLYAGYNWMTASGDESKVEKAQGTIKRAIIGLIITVGAYAIQMLVFGELLD